MIMFDNLVCELFVSITKKEKRGREGEIEGKVLNFLLLWPLLLLLILSFETFKIIDEMIIVAKYEFKKKKVFEYFPHSIFHFKNERYQIE